MKEFSGEDEGYYTQETMTSKLKQWEQAFPTKTRLFSLGKSVEGADIWCMELSKNPGSQIEFRPNVKYIANMHGDEVVGRELLMRFIEMVLTSSDPSITELLENMNIFIVPTMNPDGFKKKIRYNAHNVDLNRNFPDQYRRNSNEEQQETKVIRNFLESRQWTLSANFHGGDLVANYPWDGRPDNKPYGYNASPDDDVFIKISKQYASSNPGMMQNDGFKDGITNGAAWYVLFGGMQDYNYIHHGCMEITLEVSLNKWPPASTLDSFWEQNRISMVNYLKQVSTGLKGFVKDTITNRIIPNASIIVEDRSMMVVKSRKENGAYFRILNPGTYNITVNADGYQPLIKVVTVSQLTRFDFQLSPDQAYNLPTNQNEITVEKSVELKTLFEKHLWSDIISIILVSFVSLNIIGLISLTAYKLYALKN